MRKKGKWFRHSAEELVLTCFALVMAFTGWLFSPPVSSVSLAAPPPQKKGGGKEDGQDARETSEKSG